VPLVAIKRSTKLYRERSAAGFFATKARREGPRLNADKLEQARALLVQGHPLAVVVRETGVLADTLGKAIQAQRLPAVKKTELDYGREPMRRPAARLRPPVRPRPRRARTVRLRGRCARHLYPIQPYRPRT